LRQKAAEMIVCDIPLTRPYEKQCLDLAQRAARDPEMMHELSPPVARLTFRDIGRNRNCRPPGL
jgi:hypothetical protein